MDSFNADHAHREPLPIPRLQIILLDTACAAPLKPPRSQRAKGKVFPPSLSLVYGFMGFHT